MQETIKLEPELKCPECGMTIQHDQYDKPYRHDHITVVCDGDSFRVIPVINGRRLTQRS